VGITPRRKEPLSQSKGASHRNGGKVRDWEIIGRVKEKRFHFLEKREKAERIIGAFGRRRDN